MTTRAQPDIQDGLVARPEQPQRLIDQVVLNDATTSYTSRGVECAPFRTFLLYLALKSSGAPTTVQIVVEFLDRWSGQWYKLDEGVFASLYWEDTVLATQRYYCYSGRCLGRQMRVRAIGTGTAADATFTVSATVDFLD